MATWIEFRLVVSMIFIFHPTKGMIQVDSILGDCLVPATRFQPWYTSSWPSSHWGYQWTHWNGLAKETWPFWTSIRLNCFMAPQETLEKEVRCKFYRGSTGKSPFFGGRGLLGDQMLVAFPGSWRKWKDPYGHTESLSPLQVADPVVVRLEFALRRAFPVGVLTAASLWSGAQSQQQAMAAMVLSIKGWRIADDEFGLDPPFLAEFSIEKRLKFHQAIEFDPVRSSNISQLLWPQLARLASFGNMSYIYLDAGFIQMLKARDLSRGLRGDRGHPS